MPSDRSGTIVAAVICAAMIAGAVYRYWPSEERDIRRHLSNLSEGLSIQGTDNEVEHLTRFAALREYFSPDVRVHMDGREIVTRDAVLAIVRDVQPPPGGLAVEFTDVVVTLAETGEAARVTMTGKVSTTDPVNGESHVKARTIDLSMTKVMGDWVIAAADVGGDR